MTGNVYIVTKQRRYDAGEDICCVCISEKLAKEWIGSHRDYAYGYSVREMPVLESVPKQDREFARL